MDYSQLSTEDLKALQGGDLSKVSTEGLKSLQGQSKPAGYLDRLKTNAQNIGGEVRDIGLGALRGTASIGSTLLVPVDAAARAVGIQNDYIGRDDRRTASTDATASLGADPNSFGYKAGKLLAEGAGTAGAGGLIGKAAAPALTKFAPQVAPQIVNALRTSGFSTGAPAATTLAQGANQLAIRAGAGGVAGAAQVGLASPEDAGAGAVIGMALPPGLKVAGVVGGQLGEAAQSGAKYLMQSALKPTAAQLKSGEAEKAVQALLDYGISPNKAGVNKLQSLIDGLNTRVSDAIGASSATVDKTKVMNALSGARQKFGAQVSPTNDLQAIDNVAGDFANHPMAPGNDIPVQVAQQLKQGTYNVLKGKYGEVGSASTEAQKSLARGLKDQIAEAVPEVGQLNAEESRLLSTLTVTERRALADANKNPMGLAALAHSPVSWAMFMADRSVGFKALAARMLNRASGQASPLNELSGPAMYRSLPRAENSS